MNIQPNQPGNRNSALNFDPTKTVRELNQTRQPLPPPADQPEAPTTGPAKSADEIKAARDAHREQHQGRIANARLHHTTNQREARAAEVTDARAKYNAQLDARRKNTIGDGSKADGSKADRIEISDHTQRLMGEVASEPKHDVDARAARISELREQYLEGRLNVDSMVERAANKMLSGE